MWCYVQSTGLLHGPANQVLRCYAGKGEGKDNPLMQDVPNIGPLPCGYYTMQPPVDTITHGPRVIWLTPDLANDMRGRSAFGIHSDSVSHPGQASEGCIVDLQERRMDCWESGDHVLQVVSGQAD